MNTNTYRTVKSSNGQMIVTIELAEPRTIKVAGREHQATQIVWWSTSKSDTYFWACDDREICRASNREYNFERAFAIESTGA